MGRVSAFLLRLCVITTAIVMLVLSVRAVRAQDNSQAPAMRPSQMSADVYGYNPGQGMPHNPAPPAARQAAPAPSPLVAPYRYTPPVYAPAAYAPPQIQPQSVAPAYGYKQGDGAGRNGTQQAAAPRANYQDIAFAPAPRANADYRLGSGDKVRVTVYGEADLSGEYQLDGSGVVRLPLIGSIRAGGATAPALETEIAAALSPAYLKSPRVNVEIITYRPFYIVGAVARPGEYPYVDHISALNAVALAGGFLDTARQSTVFVRHEGSTVEQEVSTSQISELHPGDTIRVKTTLFWQAMQIFTPLTPAIYAAAAIR